MQGGYWDPRVVGGYPPAPGGYMPPQQGYAPPQQGYAPPQQAYAAQPQASYRCPQGHSLVCQAHDYPGGQYVCDGCKITAMSAQLRWRCPTCNFDLCGRCAPPAQSSQPPYHPGPPQQPPSGAVQYCNNRHPLVFQAYGYSGGEFRCDRCGSRGPISVTRWRCPPCNYDCCLNCVPPAGGAVAPPHIMSPAAHQQQPYQAAPAAMTGGNTCANKHSLTYEVVPYGGDFQCDRCRATGRSLKPRWLCRTCMYDVCNRCLPPPSHAQPIQEQLYVPPPQTGVIDPPTSKGRALLIGINYLRSPRSKLNGCINDANNLRYFLSQRGWTSFLVLTDDNSDPNYQPTRANIVKAIGWLLEGARGMQSLFFSYSGHGGQTRDTSGDESSGMDETILPCDYSTNGQIVDDELHSMLIKPLPLAVRLTCIMDCCHSGTGLDLPFVYDGTRTRSVEEVYRERGLSTKVHQRKIRPRDLNQPGLALLISGCEDEQTSADATGLAGSGVATGALTYMWLDVMNKNPNITYSAMVGTLRQHMKSKRFTQVPQFSYNLQNFNVNSPVVI